MDAQSGGGLRTNVLATQTGHQQMVAECLPPDVPAARPPA